jgi:uncharacterized protein
MNALNFLDSNVWLALIWSRHVHAEKARAWFAEASEEQFFFCRFTQLTVLRLLTTESVLGSEAKTMAEAWALWDRVCADPRVAFLPEPEHFEKEFRMRSKISSRSPELWGDAYLLAFAAASGLKFVTFDRALQSRGDEVLVL